MRHLIAISLLLLSACGDDPDRGFLVREGHQLRWERALVPLPVYLHPDTPPALAGQVERAVARWNAAAGATLFFHPVVPIPEIVPLFLDDQRRRGFTGMVLIEQGHAPDGFAFLQWDSRTGAMRNALIQAPAVGLPPDVAQRAVDHEFGHALGLDHDPMEHSVMFGSLGFEWEGLPESFLERGGDITARDRALIRATYVDR